MNSLYSGAFSAQLEARKKRCLRQMGALMLLCLAACVFLCTQVRTGNADKLLFCTVALSAVTGWTVMCLIVFSYLPACAQLQHIAGIMKEETVQHEGVMHLRREKIHIPKSVDICKLSLETEDETLIFNVDAALLDQLPQDGARVRVLVARKFITACEVIA